MQRTILVTTVKDKDNGVITDLYGRYDAVAISKKYEILEVRRGIFKMSDELFATTGELVRWSE